MHILASGSAPPLPGFLNALAGPLDHFGYWAVLLLVMLEDFGIPGARRDRAHRRLGLRGRGRPPTVVAVTVNGCRLVPVMCGPGRAFGSRAGPGRAPRLSASTPNSADLSSRPVSTECAPRRSFASAGNADSSVRAEVPVDPDHVRGGCRVDDAMVTAGRRPASPGSGDRQGERARSAAAAVPGRAARPRTRHGPGAWRRCSAGPQAACSARRTVRRRFGRGRLAGDIAAPCSSPGLSLLRRRNEDWLFGRRGRAVQDVEDVGEQRAVRCLVPGQRLQQLGRAGDRETAGTSRSDSARASARSAAWPARAGRPSSGGRARPAGAPPGP